MNIEEKIDISTCSMESLVRHCLHKATDILKDVGDLHPMFILVTKGGNEMGLLPIPPWLFDSDKAKDRLVRLMKTDVIPKYNPTRLVFVSEAWQAKAATKEEALARRPSEREDRKEVVMIVGYEPGKADTHLVAEIIRDWETNKITGTGDPDIHIMEKMSGRFVNLLD